MFTIYAKTYEGKEEKKTVLDREYKDQIVELYKTAEDCAEIIVIDGLTGEVLYDWHKNGICDKCRGGDCQTCYNETHDNYDEGYDEEYDEDNDEEYYEDDDEEYDEEPAEPMIMGFGCCESIDELCELLDALEKRRRE